MSKIKNLFRWLFLTPDQSTDLTYDLGYQDRHVHGVHIGEDSITVVHSDNTGEVLLTVHRMHMAPTVTTSKVRNYKA